MSNQTFDQWMNSVKSILFYTVVRSNACLTFDFKSAYEKGASPQQAIKDAQKTTGA